MVVISIRERLDRKYDGAVVLSIADIWVDTHGLPMVPRVQP